MMPMVYQTDPSIGVNPLVPFGCSPRCNRPLGSSWTQWLTSCWLRQYLEAVNSKGETSAKSSLKRGELTGMQPLRNWDQPPNSVFQCLFFKVYLAFFSTIEGCRTGRCCADRDLTGSGGVLYLRSSPVLMFEIHHED